MTREEIVIKLLESKKPPVFNTFADAARVKFTGCGLRKSGVDEDFHVFWMNDGQLHRLAGPAIMHVEGPCRFYINNQMVLDEEYCSHPLVISNLINEILENT